MQETHCDISAFHIFLSSLYLLPCADITHETIGLIFLVTYVIIGDYQTYFDNHVKPDLFCHPNKLLFLKPPVAELHRLTTGCVK